jgi:hypothetical protein
MCSWSRHSLSESEVLQTHHATSLQPTLKKFSPIYKTEFWNLVLIVSYFFFCLNLTDAIFPWESSNKILCFLISHAYRFSSSFQVSQFNYPDCDSEGNKLWRWFVHNFCVRNWLISLGSNWQSKVIFNRANKLVFSEWVRLYSVDTIGRVSLYFRPSCRKTNRSTNIILRRIKNDIPCI